MYEIGQLNATQYHHLVDRHYEELNGMQQRQRVGKIRSEQLEVIDAFVDEDGDREERLRKEIEGDLGMNPEYEDGIVDKYGRVIMLHPADRRAVEFRERLRTWWVVTMRFTDAGSITPYGNQSNGTTC